VPKLSGPTRVVVESGRRRVFASALDWPGWTRSAPDEEGALGALAAYAPRYHPVAAGAGVAFPARAATAFVVVERVAGSATTDFGAPGAIAEDEHADLTFSEAARRAELVRASWHVLDAVVAGAPAMLRKGPRGGGRDRDAIVDHVLDAEVAYARKVGLRLRKPDARDAGAVTAFRDEIDAALRAARSGASVVPNGWPARYAARRIAWHILDHAWEIQDKSPEA